MYCQYVRSLRSLHLLLSVFFFKQKTAYEMRISDWSSDVCSSDLRAFRAWVKDCTPGLLCTPVSTISAARASIVASQPANTRHSASGRRPRKEIGRASCRERVCQYV